MGRIDASAPTGPGFTLVGGPLHRLACRVGLVRHGTNTFPLGVALGVVPWTIGVLLAAAEGGLAPLFSVEFIGGHVRMLVAIPLFFACEAVLGPQLDRFARYCTRSGLLAGDAPAVLGARLARTRRWQDAWLPEAACLAAAVLLAVTTPATPWGGVTSGLGAQHRESLAGWWYSIVCLTLFRFLVFRWIWRLALWCQLLWRLSRLDLRLMPAHADRSGGLGMLGEVQLHFLPLIVALSAVLSSSFAEDVATGRTPFDAIYPAFVALPLGAILLVVAPLAVFAPRLLACRQQGLSDYLALAARYATAFDGKWLGRDAPSGDALLGTADVQSLADLSTAVDVVRGMRVIPVGPRLPTSVALATLLPMLPVLTLQYPITTMLEQLVNRLIGL
jgi:hypothetical protein